MGVVNLWCHRRWSAEITAVFRDLGLRRRAMTEIAVTVRFCQALRFGRPPEAAQSSASPLNPGSRAAGHRR